MEFSKIPEPTEAELRVSTANMFRAGGTLNVLQCVLVMQKCQIIVLKKLNELLEEKFNGAA